jgi:arginase
MGAGPVALAAAGAAGRLRADGHRVHEQRVEPSAGWRAELATSFEVDGLVAGAAGAAFGAGEVPLLLAGNCGTTLGVLGALAGAGARAGLVWLDAHGDFNTPDTDPGGFLDGQGLAIAVGRCWSALAAGIPGFAPLPERHVVLAGARDVTGAERTALRGSEVTWLQPAAARDPATVGTAVADLAARVDVVHVHVDLDVHDPAIAPANGFAAPDGLSAEQVQRIVRIAAEQVPVVSATLASWDPAFDVGNRMRDTALALLDTIADVAVPLP